MASYTPKHEMVDARQFTGGFENADDLIQWVEVCEGKALSALTDDDTPDLILVETSQYEYEPVFEGDWIIIHQDNRIDIMKHRLFTSRYAAFVYAGVRVGK